MIIVLPPTLQCPPCQSLKAKLDAAATAAGLAQNHSCLSDNDSHGITRPGGIKAEGLVDENQRPVMAFPGPDSPSGGHCWPSGTTKTKDAKAPSQKHS